MVELSKITQHPAIRLVCPQCGTQAGCSCGVAPIDRAAYALLKNPEKSDRAIAAEVGVDHKTVGKARRATGESSPIEQRVGRDGKIRKVARAKECVIEMSFSVALSLIGNHAAARWYRERKAEVNKLRRKLLRAERLLEDAEADVLAAAATHKSP